MDGCDGWVPMGATLGATFTIAPLLMDGLVPLDVTL